jgi:hypothetical protein
MAVQGTSIINFGAAPGTTQVALAVTGQTSILSGSYVEAWMMADSTADHNAEEHKLMAAKIGLVCGSVVAGTGFTITATSPDVRLTGQWSVRWVWN